MGILICCSRKPSRPLIHETVVLKIDEKKANLTEVDSLSYSLIQIPTNFKSEFNWSTIQSIYLGCSKSDYDLNLTLPMVKTVEIVLDEVENDLVSNAKRIFFSVSNLGGQFKTKFENYKEILDNDFKFKDCDDRILAHIISYIKFHRLLLKMFESNIREAQNILNLLSLSHVEMNINQSDFRLFDIAIEKFLIKFNVTDGHNLKITISYLNLITNYICKFIEEHSKCSNEIISDKDDFHRQQDIRRHIRKWNKLVGRLRFESCPYIEAVLDSRPDDVRLSKSLKFKTTSPLANLKSVVDYK